MRCFHCSESVPEAGCWQVVFDDEPRDVCCPGCQAVMQAIVDAGLGDYYRFRSEPARFGVIPDDLSQRLDELVVYDEPEISERYLQSVDGDPMAASQGSLVELNLSVDGMHCGACVWVLERALAALPGVSQVRVNFSSARACVRFDSERLQLSDILRRLTQVGYQGVPFDAREREQRLRRESRVFLQRLFVAGIGMMQVMMYALPAYLSGDGQIDSAQQGLLRWAGLVLTTPVLLYSALPFLQGAWRDLRRRQPGMDVPVSIGIVAAYSASVWHTLQGSGEIYFDSVAMFVFLLLGARYLEWTARRRAMRAVDDISLAVPETAQRLQGDKWESVPALRLQEGDLIRVDSGDRIPVDACVQQGESAVNTALVTGEAMPVVVRCGDEIPGGALLTGAPLTLQVLRRQSASTLSVIDRLIDRGASEKPPTVRLTDRVATVFVSALMLFALVVWLVWMQLDASRAMTTAIAVLVVSCPCALSLATPAAMAAATGELLRRRLLVTRGHAIEALASVTDVVFDKTGTLTSGRATLHSIQTGSGQSRQQVLSVAALLEEGSNHPLARALLQAHAASLAEPAASLGLSFASHDLKRLIHGAGHGVAAELTCSGGVPMALYLGSATWCGLAASVRQDWQADDDSVKRAASEVFLVYRRLQSTHLPEGSEASISSGVGADQSEAAVDERGVSTSADDRGADDSKQAPQVLARFLISDSLRPEAAALIRQLKQRGMTVHLMSGDRLPAVRQTADALSIELYKAGMTPGDKQSAVAALQAQGATVLMVGDGINDAPVLASADVSLAVGDATALARTAADVISLLPGLEGLAGLLSRAERTLSVVRQNLLWAAFYNVTAIPLAALGLVPPWAAAIGMAGSSLLVVANSQRLWWQDKATDSASQPLPSTRSWNRYSF